MGPLDILNHTLNFMAPAAAMALLLVAASVQLAKQEESEDEDSEDEPDDGVGRRAMRPAAACLVIGGAVVADRIGDAPSGPPSAEQVHRQPDARTVTGPR